ncbi:MAG: zf-HC2 domain-containing protein [Ramlibacter sp.]|nr:zf-HC2 domain-containing protein [Ramlibacter sp.]
MMNDQADADCPRTEDISALMDGELEGHAGEVLRMHLAQCSVCQPVLLRFTAMRADLLALREVRSEVDIAALVLPQLPKAPEAKRRPVWGWPGLSELGPRAVGGAAALGLGAWLGLTLAAGGGVAARPAMSVFYGEPPGAYCAGLPSCSSRGR